MNHSAKHFPFRHRLVREEYLNSPEEVILRKRKAAHYIERLGARRRRAHLALTAVLLVALAFAVRFFLTVLLS